MTKWMTSQILCVLCLFLRTPVAAHKDRIILIDNGKLVGLPDQYQPAYLNLQEKSLQVGTKHIVFPACVSKYFPENNNYTVKITASWYHATTAMPPYLLISIHPSGRNYNYRLLFNLDTPKPLKFEIEIHESESVTAFHQLVIDDICRESIERSFGAKEQ
jgi:hypothetical protein